ncbi:AAA domain-containing protein [Hydrocarboniphaga effusa]|uniref:AAA domain-containing protein n=1 Tax=Hydrocarboniphaga effusa TaxID=243629 RepID=UPI00398BE2CE
MQLETHDIQVDVDVIQATYGLNPSQCRAFAALVSKRPVGLLQGPPGAGKTRFIGALVHFALTNGLAKNVLLASQSHEAVNGAAEAVLKLYQGTGTPSILRVGHEGHVSERLLSHHVARVEARYKDRFKAEFSDRLRAIGAVLGLPPEALERFIYLERTVRPIVDRMIQIRSDGDDQQRMLGLLDTLNTQLNATYTADDIDESTFDRIVEDAAGSFCISNLSVVDRLNESPRLSRRLVGVSHAALARLGIWE